MIHLVGIAVGLFYQNLWEWVSHKYLLHGLGRKKGSFWSFHLAEHHRNARRHNYYDPDYHRSRFGWHAQGKEALIVFLSCAVHAPLLYVAPAFVLTIWASSLYSFVAHARSHLDPAWAKRFMPWHYDHHMGSDIEANWCTGFPLCDVLFRTRR